MKKTRKILSFMLVVLMLVSAVPMITNAADRWDVINANRVSGSDIVKQAKTYLGVPYDTSGGNYKYRTGFGDTMMFDCSGFVYRVCRDVGLASSRKNYTMGLTDPNGKPLEGQDSNGNYYITAHTQEQRYYGEDISASVQKYIDTGDYSELKAGDLLFITNNNISVSHVVIYSGEGTIVHSEGYQGCVSEHPINRYHINNNKSNWYFAGCRLVEKSENTTSERVEFNGHYYQVFDESLDWFEAKKRCEDLGGHLVTITSKEEQQAVTNVLSTANRNSYWMGGYKTDGTFEWITGEEMIYTNWASCQPDNYLSKEDTLLIYKNKKPGSYGHNAGCWNDLSSDGNCNNEAFFGLHNIGFICEWETNPDKPTEPSTPNEPTTEPSTPDKPDEPKNEGNIFTKIIDFFKNIINKIFSIFKW